MRRGIPSLSSGTRDEDRVGPEHRTEEVTGEVILVKDTGAKK
jgi:hypothetical protein